MFLILFSTQLSANDFLYPDYSKTAGEDVFNLLISYGFFNTDGNIDSDGNKIPLPESDSFHKSDLDIFLRFGLLKNLDIGLGFRLRSNNSVQSGVNKSVYGAESFLLASRWNFFRKGKLNLTLDGYFASTLYKNTEYHKINKLLVLGDPGSSFGLNLIAGYGFARILGLNALLGWFSPSNNLSQEILYDLRLAIIFDRFMVEAGFSGNISIRTDIYDSYKEKAVSHGFNTGGSNLFYSFNREVLAPFASLSVLFWDRLRLQVRAQRNILGRSTDEGTVFGVNLLFVFGKGAHYVEKRERPPTGKMVTGKIIEFTGQNKFAKLNLGTAKDVEKGRKVFFYRKTKVEDLLLARGVVYEVGVNWSIAKVEKYFKKETLKVGQIAKVLIEEKKNL